jgi:hypothetical protein
MRSGDYMNEEYRRCDKCKGQTRLIRTLHVRSPAVIAEVMPEGQGFILYLKCNACGHEQTQRDPFLSR